MKTFQIKSHELQRLFTLKGGFLCPVVVPFTPSWLTCVGICKEKQRCQSAEKVTEGPVEVTNVVCNSARKRQREKRIRQGQIDQIDRGGVGLLLPLADHVEDQTVATQADDENSSIENGEEDHCKALVHKHITHRRVGDQGDVFSLHHHLRTKGIATLKRHKIGLKKLKKKQKLSACDVPKNNAEQEKYTIFVNNERDRLLTADVKFSYCKSACLRWLWVCSM